ncbi:MAG TPA: serine protease [Reyranella sp.]|nr:serine protease [Reyranella sp.]
MHRMQFIASRRLVLVFALGIMCATSAVAQQPGRIFPYRWNGAFPADDITTADIQHALIWTGNYGAMVDSSYGPYTRRAISGWLTSKGYPPSDTLMRAQAIELVAEGLKLRDAYGWSTMTDPSVGFSVGIPTRLSTTRAPYSHDGALWYDSTGLFEHHVGVLSQWNACSGFDDLYTAFLKSSDTNRQVLYQARKDDWFVISGEFDNKRFYTRSQCRQQGVVTVVVNVPTARIAELGFLFTAISNSLSLRPVLNPTGPAAMRIDPPPLAPGNFASNDQSSAAPPAYQSPTPLAPMPPSEAFGVDRSGKTATIGLVLGDGQELKPQDVFARAAPAVYVVQAGDSQGSAVAIGAHELLTNCHVVGNARRVSLTREDQSVAAVVISANSDADRCVLRTEATLPAAVRVRPYSDVKVGERVFTIGTPRGLELTLGEGLISSKRTSDGVRLIQTTAPISPGSSGGGLFDASGNLIGITTFLLKNSQNLNFAIAAEEYAK